LTDSDGYTKFKATPENVKTIAEWKEKFGFANDSDAIRDIIESKRKLSKSDDKDKPGMILIKTKYPGKCIGESCIRKDRSILAGEFAYYGKGVGLMCIECNDKLEDGGDKDLVKKRLRLRYYERLLKQVKEQVDVKLQELEVLQLPEKASSIIEIDKKLAITMDEYIRKEIDPNLEDPQAHKEKVKLLDTVIATHMDAERAVKDVNLLLEQTLKKKRRKPIEVPAEEIQG
jgi:hypothetical protein